MVLFSCEDKTMTKHEVSTIFPQIRNVGEVVRGFSAGSTIVEEGEAAQQLRMLVSGWAARVRVLSDGRRQVVRLLLPGDICALPVAGSAITHCAVQAVTA